MGSHMCSNLRHMIKLYRALVYKNNEELKISIKQLARLVTKCSKIIHGHCVYAMHFCFSMKLNFILHIDLSLLGTTLIYGLVKYCHELHLFNFWPYIGAGACMSIL